jgi:tyrosyl-tRNA synthetase
MCDLLKNVLHGVHEIISIGELKNKLFSGKKLIVKFGIDPTATDLHLGHSVVINKLKILQDLGHKIVFLIGDFTAKIGDPSGRSILRPVISDEKIKINMDSYKEQVFKIIDEKKTDVRYNSEWFNKFNINDFLNLTYKNTISQMLARDDFKKRYYNKIPINMNEFIYPLLQAYDSVALNSDIEIGGIDQKFNFLLARHIQKCYGFKNVQVAIMMPLLEGIDGIKKMSKSYNNCISLNDTSKNIFGKIMSISDTLMYRYYELLTNDDLNYIKSIPPKNAKLELAKKITSKYFGDRIALETMEDFIRIFTKKYIPNDIDVYKMNCAKMKLSAIIVENRIANSNNAAKRLIEQGAVKINSKKIKLDILISMNDEFILQVGKKTFRKILPFCF